MVTLTHARWPLPHILAPLRGSVREEPQKERTTAFGRWLTAVDVRCESRDPAGMTIRRSLASAQRRGDGESFGGAPGGLPGVGPSGAEFRTDSSKPPPFEAASRLEKLWSMESVWRSGRNFTPSAQALPGDWANGSTSSSP